MLEEIERYLKEEKNQYFESHGGGIKVHSLEGGVLKIKLLGKCSTCPSAILDVEEIIEKEVMKKYPKIKKVLAVTEVDENLFEFAKQILRKS